MKGQAVETFPAFLRPDDPLYRYSDAAFHADCFAKDPQREQVEQAYAEFRTIWDSRPTDVKTAEEMEAWGRSAFASLRRKERGLD